MRKEERGTAFTIAARATHVCLKRHYSSTYTCMSIAALTKAACHVLAVRMLNSDSSMSAVSSQYKVRERVSSEYKERERPATTRRERERERVSSEYKEKERQVTPSIERVEGERETSEQKERERDERETEHRANYRPHRGGECV